MAYTAIKQIEGLNKPIIAVGGTALYIKALLYGLFEGPRSDEKIRALLSKRAEDKGLEHLYQQLKNIDPMAANRIHPNDRKRIVRALEVYQITGKPISSLQKQFEAQKPIHKWNIIGLRREKTVENRQINARVKRMIDAGLVEEVKALLAEDKPLSRQARCAIGYAEIIDYLNGRINLDDTIELVKKNTRRLAKNQRTWFKTFKNVNWVDIEGGKSPEEIFAHVKTLI